MCGIAGVLGPDVDDGVRMVSAMVGALAHRGPDGEGLWRGNGAVLGHRRLAVFDPSAAGSQPMVAPDGSVGVVFNGAIYNFRRLRAELIEAGYVFRSRSDTEVLLHGYDAWGIDRLVARLQGMFAFVIWDDGRRTGFLVRDRLGVKPLVYAVRDGTLAFASTVRALRRTGWAMELDDQAVAEFLDHGYIPEEHCIYQGMSKLPAAMILEWTAGQIRSREYWKPPSAQTGARLTFEETVRETETLFVRAVEKRLHADVPVGALLSGGIDSALVCWAISRLGGDITAFTVSTPGDIRDEAADAAATARELRIPHRIVQMAPTDSAGICDLIKAYGEPFGCASALGMLAVSHAVAPSATVLLTGDGGDDVFLGYPRHRHLMAAQVLARHLPAASASAWSAVRGIMPAAGPLRRMSHFLDYTSGGLGSFLSAREGWPEYKRLNYLGDRIAAMTPAQRTVPPSSTAARTVLGDYLEYDRKTQFVAEYLTKVDGATMYHGLEARSPFLDSELWEFAAAVPAEIRLRHGRLKAILRELAKRHIGARIARGRKRGFGIPVQGWLVTRWRPEAEAVVRESSLVAGGWLRRTPLQTDFDSAVRSGWAPIRLWYIFVLEQWLRNEGVGPG